MTLVARLAFLTLTHQSCTPRNTFRYISPTARLKAYFRRAGFARSVREQHEHHARQRDGDIIDDIYDGSHYRWLLGQPVELDGRTYPHRYFDGRYDLALGLSTDGFQLFKRSRVECWPLLLINYALPPHERTRKENLICVGLIPGELSCAALP